LGSIIKSTLFCIVASLATGTVINLFLGIIILLFSNYAQATDANDFTTTEMIHFDSPGDVGQGTLLFKSEQDYIQAPTINTDVDMTINGMIARVTVKQDFYNTTTDWQEGIYVFPLPEQAAVDHMRLHIGERVIEGEIQEKQQARKKYKQAREAGKKASLVEQERPNIFTTSVANIGPQEKIVIEIEYQQTIDYDQGRFMLRFPTVVAPRYIPGNTRIEGFAGNGWAVNTDQVPDAARITPPVYQPGQRQINPVSIRIDLNPGFKLADIDSPYHAISINENRETHYNITLQQGQIPADRDFVIVWQPVPGNTPQAALFTERKDGDTYALVMLLPPDQNAGELLDREIIFVIDTSGSMAGTSIVQARTALDLALSRLNPGDRFNIIKFNSVMESLFQSPQAASRQSIHYAQDYVRSLTARGGTEMAPALRAALSQNTTTTDIRQVIFLTDGSVGNEDNLFQIITNHLGKTRLFTIGIGSAPNSHFMRRAASFGRGTHTYIGKVSEVQEKMNELFRKLESPVLSDITINWPEQGNIEFWPRNLPDLYLGEPLLITAHADNLPDKIMVNGKIAGADWDGELNLQGGQEKSGLSILWARNKIAALMDQMHGSNEADDIRNEIINTALSHHIVSKYTSLVAVDVTPSRVPTKSSKQHAIPTHLPQGWEYDRVFGSHMPATATSAPLDFIIGLFLLGLSMVIWITLKHDCYV
jgi:Ca-activated chloride channel family protein